MIILIDFRTIARKTLTSFVSKCTKWIYYQGIMPMEPITQEHHVNINNKPIEKILLSLTAQQFFVGLCNLFTTHFFLRVLHHLLGIFFWFSKYCPMIVFIVTAQNSFSMNIFWLLSDCSSLPPTTCNTTLRFGCLYSQVTFCDTFTYFFLSHVVVSLDVVHSFLTKFTRTLFG